MHFLLLSQTLLGSICQMKTSQNLGRVELLKTWMTCHCRTSCDSSHLFTVLGFAASIIHIRLHSGWDLNASVFSSLSVPPNYVSLLQDTDWIERQAAERQWEILLLCAVAVFSEGVLSVFAAASDVWMGLNKGPILSRRHSSRGLALSFL